MASYSKVSRSKRGRDEYWNGGLALPDAKRTSSRTLAYDSDLMSLLDKIDDMVNYDSNAEGTDNVNLLDGEIGFNAVTKCREEETGMKVQAHNYIESPNEKGSSNDQMDSSKQGELTEWNSETTSSVCDIGDFENYDDVGAEFGFLADHISHEEFGIIINYILDGDTMANAMYYSNAMYGYAETTEDFNGFLWDYDIWQLNEHPVIQNDFTSSSNE